MDISTGAFMRGEAGSQSHLSSLPEVEFFRIAGSGLQVMIRVDKLESGHSSDVNGQVSWQLRLGDFCLVHPSTDIYVSGAADAHVHEATWSFLQASVPRSSRGTVQPVSVQA